ncbi:hypothetical protein [Limosilactobacillus fermentum]|uniref:hypothetical protein n=2 Tax=Limosilactobacillus fermentum TaxID=1613 RepID=UPI001C0D4EC4|nr:hypothetical protein [Limosilactobacillus fermentum]QWS02611.1 hypothetical protein I6U31_02660 [Limosilactobacillus fermentum]
MIKLIGSRLANFFLCPLLVISLVGAVAQLRDDLINVSKTSFVLLVVVILLVYAFHFVPRPKIDLFKKLKTTVMACLFILTLGWQVLLVTTLSGTSGWDPSIIETAAVGGNNWLGEKYFSIYPNTFAMVAFETHLFRLLHGVTEEQFIMILNLINIPMLDIGWVLLTYSAHKLFNNKRVTFLTVIISWLMIVVSPYVAIFYSDITSFFLGTICLSLVAIFKGTNVAWKKIVLLFFGSAISALAYFIKPSAVIVDVAIIICTVIYLINRKGRVNLRKGLITIAVVAFGFGSVYSSINYYKYHNSVVILDANKAMPMTEFIAMGLINNGGYNPYDVQTNMAIKSKDERNEKNLQMITERLKDHGLVGYLIFLTKKQIFNTSDASFGWQVDAGANGFIIPFTQYQSGIRWRIQRIFTGTSGNQNWKGNVIWVQIVWCFIIIGMLLALGSDNLVVLLLKYTVLGGMAFLLILEGGRSRYLIQFLPYIIMLSAYGWSHIRIVLSKKSYWVKEKVDVCQRH